MARTLIRRVFRRLGFATLLVLLVSSSALVLARLAPGDTTDAFDARTPEQIAEDRRRLGLDLPLHEVYGQWLARLIRLDLGTSLKYQRPVSELVGERSANTALLASTALALATVVGLPLGVFTASRRRGLIPPLVRAGSVAALSAPPLLTSLALVLLAARTGWLPIGGIGTVWHLVIPALALALPAMGTLERLQAGALSETLHERFMVAAVARGVPDRSLLWRHAFRASLAPVLGVYAIIVASLFSGSFAVEIVTSWPGLGRLMFDALIARDIHLVAGCAVAGSCFLAAGSLAADAALAWADPRTGEAS
ncbi:MAG TPA: ABC transporter permease [Vicinamibacterales bacterium]|nr:ABC transporter permease [Vicinamibacterales bacterium]